MMEPWTRETEAIVAAAQALAAQLNSSSLYQAYRRSKADIEANPALAARIRAYKQAQVAYEWARMQNKATLDDEKRVSHMYVNLSLDADAGPFLALENRLMDIYRAVYEAVQDACEIELPL